MTDLENKNLILEDDDENEDNAAQIDQESIANKIAEEDIEEVIKLDYSLETPSERNELVKKIIDKTPPEKLTNRYLEILTDYIIFAMDKEERKQKKI